MYEEAIMLNIGMIVFLLTIGYSIFTMICFNKKNCSILISKVPLPKVAAIIFVCGGLRWLPANIRAITSRRMVWLLI